MSDTLQAAGAKATAAPKIRTLSIVVADRGNVWVGELDRKRVREGFLHVQGARVIRRWGTTEGLNQLAIKGPQPNTKLDAAADVLVSERAIIAIIPCELAPWNA